MRLSEGQLLDDRYRLLRRIGSGGMADVWLATDAELDRQVALKVLHENFARDREFVERFRREASAAAGLQHPNVVGVFDRSTVDDTYYIAMEYVDGSSLRDLIASGIEMHETIEVTRQVLAAAEFAHERGIVHRDLKPLNVLIDSHGRTRVTDFGIARAGGSEITQTGSVMGTAQYLSPEQAQGIEVTAAADIYSIGVMLFEMLTGRVPFDGDNAVAIAMKQVSEQPPAPSTINPAVSPSLDAVVLRALAKDPANRFASAAEMRAALDAAEADPATGFGATERFGVVVPPEEEERSRKWLWIGLAALALLLAALLIWLLTRGDTARVPDVIGQSQAAATIRLQNAGFEVDVDRVPASTAEGSVFEQNPPAGSEAEGGSTVTISVSMGAPPEAIPDLEGRTARQARRQLRRLGFERIRSRREASDDVGAGRVIRTEPAADTELATDQPVTLILSSGTEMVQVPSVVGEDRSTATRILEQAGFLVNSDPEQSSAPVDQVIDQIPPANESLEAGEQVTIVYSTGPGTSPEPDEPDEPETVELGDYVGERSAAAQRQIRRLGLTVRIRNVDTDDPAERDVVLAQNPGPGSDARPGSRVTLEVGNFVAPEPGGEGA